LAPEVYVDDDEGYGHVIGDGTVADEEEQAARSGAANCPEQAIAVSG
jgi:ferredoxin